MTAKLTGAVAVAVLALAPIAGAAKQTVKVPKSGEYHGNPRGQDLTLDISGKTIQIAVFGFRCADTTGRMGLNDIRLKKTSKGYKFGITAYGGITFAGGEGAENGKASISGQFTRSGKRATGVFRVKSPTCHDTGQIKWSAKR